MTIIQQVRDVLEANAGTAMTTAEIAANLDGITTAQVSTALWRLRTEEDLIKQVRTGVHKYLGASERMPKLAATIEKTKDVFAGSVSDAIAEDETADHKFYTQVGRAANGDPILTNDATGQVYRATPV
jgi:hypothetical protein